MELLTSLNRLDQQLFTWLFQRGERRVVVPLARTLSRSGDGYLHVLIPALLWSLGSPKSYPVSAVLVVGMALERCLYWLLKNTLRRRRPGERLNGLQSIIVASDRFSFPSGHSSAAFFLATTVSLFYDDGVVSALFAWATGIAFSRIFLGVHFPGDTVAGAVMGSSMALLTAGILGFI